MAEIINKIAIAGLVVIVSIAVVIGGLNPRASKNHGAVIVMMNSDFLAGNGPATAPSMVLFDVDDPDLSVRELELMHDISGQIYDLYSGAAESDGSEEMDAFVRHLENDTYRANARHRVPLMLSRGRRLYVSDIMLSRQNFSPNPKQDRFAMVSITGEVSGTISHLPWDAEPTTEVDAE